MSILRAARDELRGAWRSVQYDLARHSQRARHRDVVDPDYDPFEGGPRRVIVSAGVAALVVGGAMGSYFGVVNGLGALTESTSTSSALPAAAGDTDGITAPDVSPPPIEPMRGGVPDRVARSDGGVAVPGDLFATRGTPRPAASAGNQKAGNQKAGSPKARAVGRATVPPLAPPPRVTDPGIPVPRPAPDCRDEGWLPHVDWPRSTDWFPPSPDTSPSSGAPTTDKSPWAPASPTVSPSGSVGAAPGSEPGTPAADTGR